MSQEDTYLLELVRYIHLNPARAKIVISLKDSDKYPYSGHGALMGKVRREFQDTDYVLRLFGQKVPAARKANRAYVERGIAQGRRPELVGGGLIRSAGGWTVIQVTVRVSTELGIDPEQVWRPGKHPLTVKARSLL